MNKRASQRLGYFPYGDVCMDLGFYCDKLCIFCTWSVINTVNWSSLTNRTGCVIIQLFICGCDVERIIAQVCSNTHNIINIQNDTGNLLGD